MRQKALRMSFKWLPSSLVALCLLFSATMFAQITGTIVDDSNDEPLIGASILISGTANGTVTDIDGNFSINANAGDVLEVSYTGYATQNITVGSETNLSIRLAQGAVLDEIVVTGYTSQSKKNITGAVSSVEVSEITDLPVNSVQQALQGRVAGVNITSSGAPGSGANVRIRGYGTINNNDPLYIIDGVPVQGGLNEINPNDIKSIQVLKDASSASIYGARAANGVVVITTKNGSVGGKSRVTVDFSVGNQVPNSTPSQLNPQQLADYIWELQRNAGQPFSHGQYGTGATPVLPEFINGDPSQPYDVVNNAVTRAATGNGTDWLDEIFQNASIYNLNVGASGGNEAGQYALSVGYLNQEGTVIHTNYERYSLRANTLFRPKKWLRIGENFTVSFGDRVDIPGGVRGTGNAISQAFRSPSIIPVFDEAGNFAGSKGGNLTNAANPVAQLFRNKDNNSTNLRAFGGVFLEVDIIEGLTAKTSFNVDYNNWRFKGFAFPNPEDIEGDANRNILSQSTGNTLDWTWYNTLNYNTKVGTDHNIDILVGTEAIDRTYEQLRITNSGFASFDQSNWFLDAGSGAPLVDAGQTFGNSSSIFSVFGKIDYNYQGKYLIGATVRRDGSSRFGRDNRFAVFPAFSVGWRVSDEDFMAGNAIFSDLKIRAGWGKTGNQEIGDYRFIPQFGFSANGTTYDIGGTNSSVEAGFAQTVNANPDIKWEETTSLNIGFDATLNNGFSVGFDWYNRTTEDMLVAVPAPSTGAISSDPIRNIGDVENIGVDLLLGYDKQINNDFNLGVSVNFGTYNNEVTNLGDPNTNFPGGQVREIFVSRIQEGFPIAYFYGYDINGLTDDGQFNFVDTDGNGEITGEDRTFLGSPHPDFTYGITVNLSYKAFDLSIFANGVQGNDLYNANKYFTHFNSFQGGRSTDVLNSFGYPGATGTPTLPLVSLNANPLDFNSTSFFVEDGSYFRLKNVQLGYNLPNDILASTGIESVKVFVQATNLLTITNYTGLDPEIGRSTFFGDFNSDWGIGIDSGFYPVTKTFTFGVKAGF